VRMGTGWQNVRASRVVSPKTREETISNIREAIPGYIRALGEDKLRVPEERFEALLVAV
jgi:predicted RNase H-like HicB family nuclease